ncbi:MAG: GspE/PulE family protein [Gammaproteobacteria bacterium]|nr:GspE/PulE family protein [Gammaproteobacteria bacterium]
MTDSPDTSGGERNADHPTDRTGTRPSAGTMRLGDLLIDHELITPAQLEDALKAQREDEEEHRPIGEILITSGILSENDLLRALSRHLNVEYINIAEQDYEVIDPALSTLLPARTCRRLMVVPLFMLSDQNGRHLTLAMADPLDADAIDEVEREADAQVQPVLTTYSAIMSGIETLEAHEAREAEDEETAPDDTVDTVNRLLAQAIQMRSSDLHVEPRALETHIRMRVDGELRLVETLPQHRHARMVSRIKVMGGEKSSLMRSEQRLLPQDGSFARVVGGHRVDFRVSTFPTINGEKAVVRILDRDQLRSIRTIEDIEMPPRVAQLFSRCVDQVSGIIIATGPTGSGKTTTLYAALNHINSVGKNIITVEDPVEYQAPDYINQSTLQTESGFTYPVAMRHILRQDPDALLIGEIRDLETAEVAIQAALTGHLVLTTLHTDDAASAVIRLVDLGIEQFLVSSTIVSAINQRLLRRVCPHCAGPVEPDAATLEELEIDAQVAKEILERHEDFLLRRGRGCSKCLDSGYLGRLGVFELLVVSPTLKKHIIRRETSDVIAESARAKGDVNMIFEDGLRRVLCGQTTFEELRKIPRGDYTLKGIDAIFASAGSPIPEREE